MNHKFFRLNGCLDLFAISLFLASCSSPPPVVKLTISEQISVDTQKAQSLITAFENKVEWVKLDEVEPFLSQMAKRLAKVEEGFETKLIQVRVHRDKTIGLRRFFSFPGTTISIPLSYLQSVQYENELAAGIAFELGNILKRHLAKKMEKDYLKESEGIAKKTVLFGVGSVFDLDSEERKESIQLGMRMLYLAGYDLRGMASFFQRQLDEDEDLGTDSKINHLSDMQKKELEFNIREARLAKSGFMPSLDPVVRSAEFIKMKKGLNH